MTRQHLDQPLRATVSQNYERYFVPVIGDPWPTICFASHRCVLGSVCWTLVAVPAW